MSIEYDRAGYEMPWRRNYELLSAGVAFSGTLLYGIMSLSGDYPAGPLAWMATGMGVFGAFKFKQGIKLFKRQVRLAGEPLHVTTFDELRALCTEPVHANEMWLGRGFLWGQTHTQRVMDILTRNWQTIAKEGLGPVYLWRFFKKNRELCIRHPLKAHRLYLETEKSLQQKGVSWIHGIGDEEHDIFQPLSHSEGHTLIIGTTGAGKTRCFDLLISQAILRGETVIIIDPKGDNDLKEKAQRACAILGRSDAFANFHPAKPDESEPINLLANWTRPTEIASRVANLIPSTGPSDPFKNFSWDALNKVAQGLCIAYEKPTLMTLRRYLEGSPEGMIEKSFTKYFEKIYGDKADQVISDIYANVKRDTLTNRVTALIDYYRANNLNEPALDGLISLREHDKEHFGKMVTSLLPILSMLTSGKLGQMLSPPAEEELQGERTYRDTVDFIEKNAVVYLGLDSLSDGMVGSAIGSLMLADLTAAGGSRYNFVQGAMRPVNIFVDEAAEVVNESFIQLLNKGRGAKFKLFVATQTIADFAARLGSRDKAMQVLGNINNTISLRCIDPDTQKFVADRLPKTKVKSIAVDQGLSTNPDNALPVGGRLGERLSEEEVPLFPSELLGMLPDLEFIANVSGGKVIKGRYPFLVADPTEFRPH